ncbi:MAG: hypothetical protein JXR94_17070 [Candidatus Hydrogenedentes bacterium]|nr:hypothetical protein [Candidatus Hydrogenedentota bacterium]
MAKPVREIQLVLPSGGNPVVQRIADIFARQVEARSSAEAGASEGASLRVVLAIEPGPDPEAFTIAGEPDGAVRITGHDARGLLYGVGKFLRASQYGEEGFTPGAWRGASAPKGAFRALYCATHFMNYYEAAPADEMGRYLEDVALWGANTVMVTFPTWQFTGFDDPKAEMNLKRLHELHGMAKGIGLQAGLMLCPNQGFASAPEAIRATRVPDDLGRRGWHGVNCCPSLPQGREYLTGLYGQLFDEFAEEGVDYIVFWPYDEGGCGCETCWPWGARGYPRLSREIAALARQRFPAVKTVLSTWVYDTPPAGEWEGLAAFLKPDASWLDFIMADSHEDFPRYPLETGSPAGLPLVNFPEISMWGQSPWGGYGANPLPARLERLWQQTEGRVQGGEPYSEGIYEDINKAICYQFYWDPGRSAMETVAEYLAFEFSPDVVDDLLEVVRIFEANHVRTQIGESALRAFELVKQVEDKLSQSARQAWRWRIVYLRAQIDAELYRTEGRLEGEILKNAFDELTSIYHAEAAHSMPIRPPRIE